MNSPLGTALQAFILEREYCGELVSNVEPDRVVMLCSCGAVISRVLEPVA